MHSRRALIGFVALSAVLSGCGDNGSNMMGPTGDLRGSIVGQAPAGDVRSTFQIVQGTGDITSAVTQFRALLGDPVNGAAPGDPRRSAGGRSTGTAFRRSSPTSTPSRRGSSTTGEPISAARAPASVPPTTTFSLSIRTMPPSSSRSASPRPSRRSGVPTWTCCSPSRVPRRRRR